MNAFQAGRVMVYREHCAALRHLSPARWTDAYFPEVITDMIRLYCDMSEEEHFVQVISTWRVSGEFDYDHDHMLDMTLDRGICNTMFGRVNRRMSTIHMAEMMKDFDADGLVDKVSWYLPRFIQEYIEDEEWDMDKCYHGAEQLAVGFLKSYVAVAREQTASI